MTEYVEIDSDAWRFHMRVGAVCIRSAHVLLQHAIDGEFWHTPGGRLLPTESSIDALVRTMRWELGEEVTVKRLLWVTEVGYPAGGRAIHEVAFYHAIELPEGSRFVELGEEHAGVERGHPLRLRWFALDASADLVIQPDFLRTALKRIPESIEHITDMRG